MSDDDRDGPERLRVDRWLWCARLFKSRSVAAEAVRAGHVRLNGQRVKAAHAVKIGDVLQVELANDAEREVEILAIPMRRGPAREASACYLETPESVERGRRAAEARALRGSYAPPTVGRPDKRTRRLLLRARQRSAFGES